MYTLTQARAQPWATPYPLTDVHLSTSFAVIPTTGKKFNPATDAAMFYAAHEAAANVAGRYVPNAALAPADEAVIRWYGDIVRTQSLRIAQYLLYIVSRELRHGKKASAGAAMNKAKVPSHVQAVVLHFVNSGSDTLAAMTASKPGHVRTATYLNAVVATYKGKGWGASYGGPKWAAIAQVLADFYAGKISGEVLTDLAYALEHNTCNIFNKPAIYESVSDDCMRRLLDAQRGGQVVQLLRNSAWQGDFGSVFSPVLDALEDFPMFAAPPYTAEFDADAVVAAGAICNWKGSHGYRTASGSKITDTKPGGHPWGVSPTTGDGSSKASGGAAWK